eukprot:m.18784 g.18784  ORF g.18784 m.18784 type:complete len:704 (+) comp7442_c0_seq2:206-2317(+)
MNSLTEVADGAAALAKRSRPETPPNVPPSAKDDSKELFGEVEEAGVPETPVLTTEIITAIITEPSTGAQQEILLPSLYPLIRHEPEILSRIRFPSFQAGLALIAKGAKHTSDCPAFESGAYDTPRTCVCQRRLARPAHLVSAGKRRQTVIVAETDLMCFPLRQLNAFIQDSGLADSMYVEYTRFLRDMWHLPFFANTRLSDNCCELGCGHLKEFRQQISAAQLTQNGQRFLEEERERFMNRRQQQNSRTRRRELKEAHDNATTADGPIGGSNGNFLDDGPMTSGMGSLMSRGAGGHGSGAGVGVGGAGGPAGGVSAGGAGAGAGGVDGGRQSIFSGPYGNSFPQYMLPTLGGQPPMGAPGAGPGQPRPSMSYPFWPPGTQSGLMNGAMLPGMSQAQPPPHGGPPMVGTSVGSHVGQMHMPQLQMPIHSSFQQSSNGPTLHVPGASSNHPLGAVSAAGGAGGNTGGVGGGVNGHNAGGMAPMMQGMPYLPNGGGGMGASGPPLNPYAGPPLGPAALQQHHMQQFHFQQQQQQQQQQHQQQQHQLGSGQHQGQAQAQGLMNGGDGGVYPTRTTALARRVGMASSASELTAARNLSMIMLGASSRSTGVGEGQGVGSHGAVEGDAAHVGFDGAEGGQARVALEAGDELLNTADALAALTPRGIIHAGDHGPGPANGHVAVETAMGELEDEEGDEDGDLDDEDEGDE